MSTELRVYYVRTKRQYTEVIRVVASSHKKALEFASYYGSECPREDETSVESSVVTVAPDETP